VYECDAKTPPFYSYIGIGTIITMTSYSATIIIYPGSAAAALCVLLIKKKKCAVIYDSDLTDLTLRVVIHICGKKESWF